MIIALGLMTSVYTNFLVLGSTTGGKTPEGGRISTVHRTAVWEGSLLSLMRRLACLVLLVSTLTTADFLFHLGFVQEALSGSPSFFDAGYALTLWDGSIKFAFAPLFANLFLSCLALGILSLGMDYKGILLRGTGTQSETGALLPLILLTNLIGLSCVLQSNDWIITVTAWELFNLSLYLLVGMTKTRYAETSLSASVKYFLLSALTTSFLLLAVALLYGLTGSTHYDNIAMVITSDPAGAAELRSYGPLTLIIITLIFKLGAAPLHNWAPDLLDSVSNAVALWMSTIPKLAVLCFLSQVLEIIPTASYALGRFALPPISQLLLGIGVLCTIVGSIGLGSQWKIKRFLAYSGITNIGFMLIAISLRAPLNSFYIYAIIYGFTVLCIFGVLSVMATAYGFELEYVSDLAGIYRLNPSLALTLIICFFSLIGVPPLIGFYTKLLVLNSLINYAFYVLAIIVILASTLSSASYLSIIKTSLFDCPIAYDSGASTLNGHSGTLIKAPLAIAALMSSIAGGLIIFLLNPAVTSLLDLALIGLGATQALAAPVMAWPGLGFAAATLETPKTPALPTATNLKVPCCLRSGFIDYLAL